MPRSAAFDLSVETEPKSPPVFHGKLAPHLSRERDLGKHAVTSRTKLVPHESEPHLDARSVARTVRELYSAVEKLEKGTSASHGRTPSPPRLVSPTRRQSFSPTRRQSFSSDHSGRISPTRSNRSSTSPRMANEAMLHLAMGEISALTARLENSEQAQREMADQHSLQATAFASTAADLQAFKQQTASFQREASAAHDEIGELRAEMNQLRERTARAESALSETRAELAEMKRSFGPELRRDVDALRHTVQSWSSAFAFSAAACGDNPFDMLRAMMSGGAPPAMQTPPQRLSPAACSRGAGPAARGASSAARPLARTNTPEPDHEASYEEEEEEEEAVAPPSRAARATAPPPPHGYRSPAAGRLSAAEVRASLRSRRERREETARASAEGPSAAMPIAPAGGAGAGPSTPWQQHWLQSVQPPPPLAPAAQQRMSPAT